MCNNLIPMSNAPIVPDCFHLLPDSGAKGGFMTTDKLDFSCLEPFGFQGFPDPPRLIPPIVESVYSVSQETLFVQAFLHIRVPQFIQKDNFDTYFNIYMKQKWTGTLYTPEFLIQFDFKIPDEPTFMLYKFSFIVNKKFMPTGIMPSEITTYLWSSDPEGSRGTVSDPQSGG